MQVLLSARRRSTLEIMSLLTLRPRVRRPRCQTSAPSPADRNPLPDAVRLRVQLSADLVRALLEVEGRAKPTLDDLEWADAVAARMARRQCERERQVDA